MIQLMPSVSFEEADIPALTLAPASSGMVPIAITMNPWDAISLRKRTCSHGESVQAPLPHTSTGSGLLLSNTERSCGLKIVWVVREPSVTITALYSPVPPFSKASDLMSCP